MPRRYNSKETIELILAASMKLFSEKGFDKTSMQEIVDESGVSKGSIFHHFKSKEEILTTAIVNQAKAHEQILCQWLNGLDGMTGKEKMATLIDRLFEDVETDKTTERFGEQVFKSPQMILAIMQESLKIAAPIYAKILKEGIEDGSITVALPDECAEAFSLLINFWCDATIFQSSAEHVSKRLMFVQQMMRALGADVISDQHISQFIKLYGGLQNELNSK